MFAGNKNRRIDALEEVARTCMDERTHGRSLFISPMETSLISQKEATSIVRNYVRYRHATRIRKNY